MFGEICVPIREKKAVQTSTLTSEAEFVKLINKNQGIIHKVCGMYCHDKDEKKDLFQEIVLQLWKSFATFRGESKITTWIYRVALNTAISTFRKEVKKPATSLLDDTNLQIAEDTEFQEKNEQYNMLYQAIRQLSEIERALVMLYLDDLPYEEIAETMGITANNARVRMNRIREKLREIVKLINV